MLNKVESLASRHNSCFGTLIKNRSFQSIAHVYFWPTCSIYGLSTLFSYANFYSLGLSVPFYLLFFPILICAPLFGAVWFYYTAAILYQVGRLFGGKADFQSILFSVGISKIPRIASLFMWLVFFFFYSETAFIQPTEGFFLLVLFFISLITNVWSVRLLIKFIQKFQSFNLFQSIGNVFISQFISYFFAVMFVFLIRCIIISF